MEVIPIVKRSNIVYKYNCFWIYNNQISIQGYGEYRKIILVTGVPILGTRFLIFKISLPLINNRYIKKLLKYSISSIIVYFEMYLFNIRGP